MPRGGGEVGNTCVGGGDRRFHCGCHWQYGTGTDAAAGRRWEMRFRWVEGGGGGGFAWTTASSFLGAGFLTCGRGFVLAPF